MKNYRLGAVLALLEQAGQAAELRHFALNSEPTPTGRNTKAADQAADKAFAIYNAVAPALIALDVAEDRKAAINLGRKVRDYVLAQDRYRPFDSYTVAAMEVLDDLFPGEARDYVLDIAQYIQDEHNEVAEALAKVRIIVPSTLKEDA